MKKSKPQQALVAFLLLQASCFGDVVAYPGSESSMQSSAVNSGKLAANPGPETTAESVAKLSDLTYILHFPPGGSAISPDNSDLTDIRDILRNSRFLKSYAELRTLDKAAAAQIVSTNLSSALTKYLPLYETSLRNLAPYFNITNTASQYHAMSFEMRGPTNEPGKEVLMGLRLKILSLVWMSGLLNLTNNHDQVEEVVRVATNQRKELYDDPTLTASFKFTMRHVASLYNRQILSSGLIGVTFNGNGLETNAMNAAGVHWQQSTQTISGAFLHGPVESVSDYSPANFPLNFTSQMNDTNFDILLREIGFKQ